jgi:hypothetical protein
LQNNYAKRKLIITLRKVEELLQKKCIEEVPQKEMNQGFYRTLFLVPKKTGDLRLVINLKPINKYLRKQHFEMDSMKTALNLIRKGDFAISIDLKDTYMHIPIFHFKITKYIQDLQWAAKCINGSIFAFTKVVAVVAAFLRQQNLRLAVYLDDWLGLNSLHENLLHDLSRMISVIIHLGFLKSMTLLLRLGNLVLSIRLFSCLVVPVFFT